MRKFIKWFLFSVFVLGSIALAICYMVIPNETKSAMDVVVGYLNTPLGIVGGTTITIGMVAGIIAKVVYDRYKSSIKQDLEDYKNKVEEITNQAKDYESIANEHYNQINALCEQEKEKNEYLLKQLENICKTIPNVKINAIGEEIRKGLENYGREETTND